MFGCGTLGADELGDDHDRLLGQPPRRTGAQLAGLSFEELAEQLAPELEAAIRAGGNRDVTVRVFPALNHLFLPDAEGTADPARYARLPEKRVPGEVLGSLADWLKTAPGPAPPVGRDT